MEHLQNFIIQPKTKGLLRLRFVLLIALIFNSLAGIWLAILALSPPAIYRKDIIQEYVLAKAVLMRIDPYLPLPELVELTIRKPPVEILPHPTPHPPPVAILSLPLALLTYPQAASLWFLIELGLVLLISYLLFTGLGTKAHWMWIGITALLFLAWQPFIKDIIFGQLMILLLAILTAAWLALRKDQFIWGGLLLGLAISIKIMMWPVLFILISRKYWRSALMALGTVAVTNLVSALVLGFGTIMHYYLQIGHEVFLLYRSFAANYSLWTIGWRLFTGTGSKVQVYITTPPIVSAPTLAPYISITLPLFIFVVGLFIARRMAHFDDAYATMVIVSLLISPITWMHYFSLTIIPLIIIYRNLTAFPLHPRLTFIFLISSSILLVPDQFLRSIYKNVALSPYVVGYDIHVSWLLGMITYLPTAALLGLMWILIKQTSQESLSQER